METKYPRRVSPKWRLKIYYDNVFIKKENRSYKKLKQDLIKIIKQNQINFITKITIKKIK